MVSSLHKKEDRRKTGCSLNIWGYSQSLAAHLSFLHKTFGKAPPLSNARHEGTRKCELSFMVIVLQDCLCMTRRGETLTGAVLLLPVWLEYLSNDEMRQGLLDEVYGHNLGTADVCSQLRTELYLSRRTYPFRQSTRLCSMATISMEKSPVPPPELD